MIVQAFTTQLGFYDGSLLPLFQLTLFNETVSKRMAVPFWGMR
jgi:hypothetical protein